MAPNKQAPCHSLPGLPFEPTEGIEQAGAAAALGASHHQAHHRTKGARQVEAEGTVDQELGEEFRPHDNYMALLDRFRMLKSRLANPQPRKVRLRQLPH